VQLPQRLRLRGTACEAGPPDREISAGVTAEELDSLVYPTPVLSVDQVRRAMHTVSCDQRVYFAMCIKTTLDVALHTWRSCGSPSRVQPPQTDRITFLRSCWMCEQMLRRSSDGRSVRSTVMLLFEEMALRPTDGVFVIHFFRHARTDGVDTRGSVPGPELEASSPVSLTQPGRDLHVTLQTAWIKLCGCPTPDQTKQSWPLIKKICMHIMLRMRVP
jgi:hypothetical protein